MDLWKLCVLFDFFCMYCKLLIQTSHIQYKFFHDLVLLQKSTAIQIFLCTYCFLWNTRGCLNITFPPVKKWDTHSICKFIPQWCAWVVSNSVMCVASAQGVSVYHYQSITQTHRVADVPEVSASRENIDS